MTSAMETLPHHLAHCNKILEYVTSLGVDRMIVHIYLAAKDKNGITNVTLEADNHKDLTYLSSLSFIWRRGDDWTFKQMEDSVEMYGPDGPLCF